MVTPQSIDNREHLGIRAVLVTRHRELYDSLKDSLASWGVLLRWETSAQDAVEIAEAEDCPVILAGAECDWRYLVHAFDRSPTRPNVIVLLPRFDQGLWVKGYDEGAFDVLPFEVGSERVALTVTAAHKRWRWRQLVSEARARNPMAGNVLH